MNQTKGSVDEEPRVRPSAYQNYSVAIARLLCLGVIVVTLSTLPAYYFWVSDLLANLRIQQVIAISFSIIVSLFTKQYRLAGIAGICAAIHLSIILPQLMPETTAVASQDNAMRVMTLNVLTNNRSHRQIVDEIQTVDPDTFAVIELSPRLLRFLAEQLQDKYPYVVAHPETQSNFGIGLFSRFPLEDAEWFQLNEEIKSVQARCHGYHVIATHPLPPMGSRLFRSRNEHLSLLARHINEIQTANQQTPLIVMGDFNVTPWSPFFRRFQGQSGVRRAADGMALTPTWYAGGSSFPFGLVLDHLFVSESVGCADYRVGGDIGSDHRSVSAVISCRN